MRMIFGCVFAASLAITALTSSPAEAKSRIKKYCQGGQHMHYGSGSGPSKKAANRAAIRAWSDFTSFEYGGAYARFANARFKRVRCARASSGWSCSAEANPCRVNR